MLLFGCALGPRPDRDTAVEREPWEKINKTVLEGKSCPSNKYLLLRIVIGIPARIILVFDGKMLEASL